MGTLLQDLKFGLRQMCRNPGFTAVAVLTLALGIGANTAIFSVVNGVLLNPLPYPQPDRLIALYWKTALSSRSAVPYPNFLDWERDNHSFSAVAASVSDNFNMTGSGESERVPGERISANFFTVLGVKPVIGRTFISEEDRVGAAPVALISSGLWMRKFGESPDILGKAITLNGVAHSIVGVIPSSPYYGDAFDPVGQMSDPTLRDRRTGMGMSVVGRLKPGVTFQQAKADMDAVARHLAEQYPEADKDTGITLVPLKQNVVGDVQPYLLMLLAAVGFVLLVACVNVANLMLARSTGRTREFAIRIALGAARGRVIRQLLTESILLALAGGGLGLLVATWGLQGALKVLPAALPRAQEVHLDGRVLLFALAASLLTGILFGLAPALKTSAANLQETLKEGGREASAAHHRTQSAFVVAEVALALVLLAGAGLMIRSLSALWSVDPGFNPHHVLTFRATFPSPKSADAIRAEWRQIHDNLVAIPGIQAASVTLVSTPMGSNSNLPFWLEAEPKPQTMSQMKMALMYAVQPDYLKVMRIPLERGRFLTANDTAHAPLVIVIDDRFAQRYFPGQIPIGRRVNFGILNQTAEIVGVVGHVKQWGLDESASSSVLAQFYMSAYQIPDQFVPLMASKFGLSIFVRAQGSPLADVGAIRHALHQINSQSVIYDTATMDSILLDSLSSRRFSMILMGVFAALALLMASVGLYGVISYVTSQRTHEIGVRMALGAERRDILRMVLGQGLKLALIGVAIGIIGALMLTRFLASLLYGVKPTDPLTFITVALILTAVALAACYVPARRAAKVDPMEALRYE